MGVATGTDITEHEGVKKLKGLRYQTGYPRNKLYTSSLEMVL
jgi:hypothetical protein